MDFCNGKGCCSQRSCAESCRRLSLFELSFRKSEMHFVVIDVGMLWHWAIHKKNIAQISNKSPPNLMRQRLAQTFFFVGDDPVSRVISQQGSGAFWGSCCRTPSSMSRIWFCCVLGCTYSICTVWYFVTWFCRASCWTMISSVSIMWYKYNPSSTAKGGRNFKIGNL